MVLRNLKVGKGKSTEINFTNVKIIKLDPLLHVWLSILEQKKYIRQN